MYSDPFIHAEKEDYLQGFWGITGLLVDGYLVCKVLLKLRVGGKLELDKGFVLASAGNRKINRTAPIVDLTIDIRRGAKPRQPIEDV